MFGGSVFLAGVILVGSAGCFLKHITTPGDETGLIRARVEAVLPNRDPLSKHSSITVSYLSTPREQVDPNRRPILYVHGTPGDATNWGAYLREPVGGRPSVAIDRPGFGSSIETGAVTSFADQAAALKPLLEQFDRPAILVGHSLGGPIIARAAADYPDRVAALVIAAGSLDPDLEELHWYNYAAELPLMGLFLPRAIMHSNAEVLAAKDEEIKLKSVLAQVRCPVIIVHGTKDELVPYANAAYTESHCVNAAAVELITLEGANHFIIWQHVDAIRRAIERADELADQVERSPASP